MKKNLIIIGYARAGITILNRCLASDERLVCLSEINTKYICPTQPNTPHQQVKDWYNIDISETNTLEEVSEIFGYCETHSKILIVRDWSFGSFVPLRYNEFQPTNTLNTVDDIVNKFPNKFEVICMVRNPIDIWLSMRYSEKAFYDKKLDFLLKFTEDVLNRKLEIIKYEDFCDNPAGVLEKIYKKIGISTPETLKLTNKVIGDTNYPSSSRGSELNYVSRLERREVTDKDFIFLKEETRFSDITTLLNYDKI